MSKAEQSIEFCLDERLPDPGTEATIWQPIANRISKTTFPIIDPFENVGVLPKGEGALYL